ncbi:MAG: ABC transporter permease [Puniceicoccaceae bacterium]|nr:MAG: ABC transporter permease [Puniceicoccaceae bacterium]
MSWYLYLALRQLFPAGKRFPFITLVSVAGVMLGVAVLIIVLGVMNGFGEEIRRKVVDTQGHLRVESGQILYRYQEVIAELEQRPEVVAAVPYAAGMVMVQHANRPAFPLVQGIDPAAEQGVMPLDDFLIYGRPEDLDDDSVFLSVFLARSLGVIPGGEVEIYSPLLLERLRQDEILLPRSVRVAGLFETGWHQIDENTVITTLRLMQDLYGLGDGVHGIKVRLRDRDDPDTVVAALNRELEPPLRAISWLDANRDFLFILQLEKNVLFFLLLFIVLVSAFAITSSLLITVVRKTREIGLLGALGARPWQVGQCFCLQGLFIGICGTSLGFAFGFLALHFRNDIIQTFARLTQSEAALVRFYQFSVLPAETDPRDLFLIAAASLVISTLAGLIPAWRAARLDPTEALRSE